MIDINTSLGPSWYDCSSWPIGLGDPNDYEIGEMIGSGKYSEIFLGYSISLRLPVALKVLKPVRENKYYREAKILHNLRSSRFVIKLLDIIRTENNQITFVFEYFDYVPSQELYLKMNDSETRSYLYQLITAIQFSHSNGIMHRDIKPQNVLYNYRTSTLKLIDWGLSEFYFPNQSYSTHVASRNYKPIELFLSYAKYDYSIDIWGFGVIMLSIVTHTNPYLNSQNLSKVK